MFLHRRLGHGTGWRVLAPVLACLVALLLAATAARAQDAGPIVLDPAHPEVLVTSVPAWLGPQPRGGIDAASSGRVPFQPLALAQGVRFREGESLWLKLQLAPVRGSSESWHLEIPVPLIDVVTLYQRDASGRWFGRSAGDLVPMREWPQAGRYPFFRVQLREAAVTEVYLQVRHATALPLPLRLTTDAAHEQRAQGEYLALGLLMGALGLLVVASLVRAVLLRDTAYVWYAAYALVSVLAAAAYTGVAAHMLWGNAARWADAAPGSLALLGGGLGMLVVTRLSGAVARVRWLGRSLYVLVLLGLVFAALFPLLERNLGVALLALHMVAVAGLTLYAAVVTWRRDDAVGLWMLLGAVPLTLMLVVALLRVFGVLQASWLADYALVLALTLNLPMGFAALNSRSHERRSVELRRLAAASQDALTGLPKRGPFVARLQQALARYDRRGEGAAVAVIEVVNHAWIQKTRGAEAAEEALLRTVIKLRRLVRDVDTAGRVGENRFGLILEGVAMRRPMNTVATRLVAAGLMEEPDSPRDSVLHFHVAAVVLGEHRAPAEELLQSLGQVLDGMPARARRPLRFLEPGGGASAAEAGPPAPEDPTGATAAVA